MFLQKFRDVVPKHLSTPWETEDGLTHAVLDAELAHPVPLALREFYQALGNSELMEAYYFFWDPDELEHDEGYLLFLEDEEEEHTWGIRVDQIDVPDPLVWRRNNAKGSWICEEGTFSEFVLDYFDWVFSDEDDDED